MSWIKNLCIVITSFTISIFLAEALARSIVGGPDYMNNGMQDIDDNFGFKVDVDFVNIDNFGFRNANDKRLVYDLAAVGDSHTYGYNVSARDSWPAHLEEISDRKVYNFGIGANGIYSYHFLISQELKKEKDIILGLYIPNDFAKNGYVCSIDFDNEFWVNEINRIGLTQKNCLHSKYDGEQRHSVKRALRNLSRSSTLLSLMKQKFYHPIRRAILKRGTTYLNIGSVFEPLSLSTLNSTSSSTDLSQMSVLHSFNDFEKMLKEWKNLSEKGQLGIVIIPSRQSVYRAAIEQLGIQNNLENFNTLREATKNELNLEKEIISLIHDFGFPVKSARYAVAAAFIDELQAKGVDKFYPDGGHPAIKGYRAYASVAHYVLSNMQKTK